MYRDILFANASKVDQKLIFVNVKYRFISGFTTRVQPQDHPLRIEFLLRLGPVRFGIFGFGEPIFFLGAKSQIKKRSN